MGFRNRFETAGAPGFRGILPRFVAVVAPDTASVLRMSAGAAYGPRGNSPMHKLILRRPW